MAGIAVLALLIHFLFHPIDRLKLGMLLTQSYEITVSEKSNGVNPVTRVLTDRDVICVIYKGPYELPFGMGLSPDRVYYESTKDGVWKYSHYPTDEWKRKQTDYAQITPGTGCEPLWDERWYPIYRKIQDKKKNLVLLGGINECNMAGAERMIKTLDPTGFYIKCWCSSRDKGEWMIEQVTKWSE